MAGARNGKKPTSPKLVTLDPRTMTAEDIGRMFTELTGKDMTPEELAEIEPIMAEIRAELAKPGEEEDEEDEDEE